MKEIENIQEAIENNRLFREKMLSDPYRPRYHFAIPEGIGMPGDPNGAFYANGRYHLMYLYDCNADKYRWGHMSSVDLLHWRSHPDALMPDDLDGGIFSGGAFADDSGTVYLSYWALPRDGAGGIRIAYSNDVENHYEKWEKSDGYAIKCTEGGILEIQGENGEKQFLCCSDPSNIWKKDGVYYMQAGNLPVLNKFRNDEAAPKYYRGDWTDLFFSIDMKNWEYLDRFYQRDINNEWTDESEDDMCPSFLPLPDTKEGGQSDKYLQLFISHNKGCQYYIGAYDKNNNVFIPEKHGRMSWNDNAFFAPEALTDKNGRQIMWSWLTDNPPNELERGWSGVYGLPRALWLGAEGDLGMAPISELEKLRYNHANTFDVNYGNSCEIKIVIDMKSAAKAGVKVRCAPDGSEYTSIYYDRSKNQIIFDETKSGAQGSSVKGPFCQTVPSQIEAAPFVLKGFEFLSMNIFIDNSVVEVFVNERQAITRRVYNKRKDSKGIKLFSEGDIDIVSLDVWEIAPTNFY